MKHLVDMKRLPYPSAAHTGAPTELALGLASFWGSISSSHSLTSRKHSLWTPIREHIDLPFQKAMASIPPGQFHALVEGLRPSLMWRSPNQRILVIARSCMDASRYYLRDVSEDLSAADQRISALMQWDECMRIAARFAPNCQGQSAYVASLDTMRSLIAKLRHFRPQREIDAAGTVHKDFRTRVDQDSFCELCWRLSMRTVALLGGTRTISAQRKSGRFCSVHDPSNPKSQYRRDLRYRTAFRREVDALSKMDSTAFLISPIVHVGADFADMRRAAYNLVHARLRPSNSSTPGLRECVAHLLSQGVSQSEAARQLGISRQAVSQANKSLEKTVASRLRQGCAFEKRDELAAFAISQSAYRFDLETD